MTTANKITIGRILLVPFFVVQMIYFNRTGNEWHYVAALLFFAVAAVTDGLDGYIARRYNQRSELGALLDPLADKILLISAIVLLSQESFQFDRIPPWLTATILSRDVLLVIGLLVIHYTFGKIHVRPRIAGKIATVLQMAVVLWTLLHWSKGVLPWLYYAAGIFTAFAGLQYVWDGMSQLSKSPTSSPKKNGE